MKNLYLVGLLMLCFSCIQAQYDPSKISKKSLENYSRAIEFASDGRYPEAISLLNDAVNRDPNYLEAYLSLGGIYGQVKNYQASVDNYRKAFAIDKKYAAGYELPYSINLAGTGDFQGALDAVNELISFPKISAKTLGAAEYRKRTYQFGVDYAKAHPNNSYQFKPHNMGDGINSSESEYFPSLPVDGSELIFTRRLKNINEDFFGSVPVDTGWGPAIHLTGDINTSMNEGAQNISQDGKTLVFTACQREDGYGSCDIYISELTDKGWSQAKNIGSAINTENWESMPCLSPDKRELYFVSRRPGGYGGSDIYVSRLSADGKWGTPLNLGPAINTPGDEASPFIHADNQTFYFSSDGLPGYGEADLFVMKRQDDGTWSKPLNLGYPINTISHEGTLFVAADSKTAYYASDRGDSRGGLDIYSFDLRDDVRPNRTLWVKGKVYDKKTNQPLPSMVELTDIKTGKRLNRVQTDQQGNYLVTLPVGRDYAFNVARNGYLIFSENYSLSGRPADSTYNKDIPLIPIEVNASVALRNIFFNSGESQLLPGSETELERILILLQDNPGVKILVSGHTDNVGSAADNLKLSEARAKAVINYLVQKGIPAQRLTSKGFGATKPISSNDTEDGRARNRRTEITITAK